MCHPKRARTAVCLALIFSALLTVPPGQPQVALAQELRYPSEADLIEVIFVREAAVRLRGGLPVDLGETKGLPGVENVLARVPWSLWSRICDTPENLIDEATARGEGATGEPLHNPNNMYRVQIGPGADVWELSHALEALPGVLLARPVPKPMALPTPPDYISQQAYLRAGSYTPAGVDADAAWTWPGGTGAGITVCDLEYSWNWSHQDLNWSGETHLYIQDPQSNDNHGTSVLGVMGSKDNGYGTKGICFGSTMRTCGTYFKPIGGSTYSWDVPGSIVDAASTAMQAGDILLIEHQWDLPGRGLVPIEWWTCTGTTQTANAVYLNIQWAIATKKMHVVEPAGNGNVNLDGLTWYGDSGAIIVGAGGAYPGGTWSEGDLQRLSFSSYGSRVDVQGWGENVVTTGGSDLYSAEGKNLWYTAAFDGTSSASPVVAGALACCGSCWKTNICSRFPIHPAHARDLLKRSGTPQITPPAGNIGPRPNLGLALPWMYEWRDATLSPLETGSSAPCWGDYDNDGDLDLYQGNLHPYANRLLQNNGNGAFTDVTPDLLKLSSYDSYGGVWGDYDNDGSLDLYVYNYGTGQCKLFHNNGSGSSWTDATSGPLGGSPAGVSPVPTWIDYDNDGDIDLYLANYGGANKLLRNNGGGSFTDVTSGPEGDTGATTCAAWSDYDLDGDQDVYIVNSNSSNHLLRNDHGTFVNVTVPPLDVYEGGTAYWGDYDNDGDFDLYLIVPNYWSYNRLFKNNHGTFVDVTAGPIIGIEHDYQAGWLDMDNDSDLDLYLANNTERNRMFLNNGSGTFTDYLNSLLMWEGYQTSFSWGDCDNDGDIDIYFAVGYPANSNLLARNGSTGGAHWLQVQLRGISSNRCGIGARIRVVTPYATQTQEIKANALEENLIATFGLMWATGVDSLRIYWPSGLVQDSLNVAADQRVVIFEGMDASDVGEGEAAPLLTRLHPGAPNPSAAGTPALIRYDLSRTSAVLLNVHDLSGRIVAELARFESRPPGSYAVAWNGRDDDGGLLPSGVYFVRMRAGAYEGRQRLVLIR